MADCLRRGRFEGCFSNLHLRRDTRAFSNRKRFVGFQWVRCHIRTRSQKTEQIFDWLPTMAHFARLAIHHSWTYQPNTCPGWCASLSWTVLSAFHSFLLAMKKLALSTPEPRSTRCINYSNLVILNLWAMSIAFIVKGCKVYSHLVWQATDF